MSTEPRQRLLRLPAMGSMTTRLFPQLQLSGGGGPTCPARLAAYFAATGRGERPSSPLLGGEGCGRLVLDEKEGMAQGSWDGRIGLKGPWIPFLRNECNPSSSGSSWKGTVVQS